MNSTNQGFALTLFPRVLCGLSFSCLVQDLTGWGIKVSQESMMVLLAIYLVTATLKFINRQF
jgi:hypothetical protein